jgi:hypothetical protein
MADRRSTSPQYSLDPQVYRKESDFSSTYKPLGQILLDEKLVSFDQLEEALSVHWRKGIILGETLKELGYLNEGGLLKALEMQKLTLSRGKHL